MPYGDLEAMRMQRFATLADIDAANPTIEEREEYEAPVRAGLTMFAGVDYRAVLDAAEQEADVIVWDGGNNDFSFFEPRLTIVAADPLRVGDELTYHPGEANVRMADVVVLTKAERATSDQLGELRDHVQSLNPRAVIVATESPVVLDAGPDLRGRRVLVIDDGPTLTHGGMPFGAGFVAAERAGAVIVDPRPTAVGSIRAAFESYPHLGPVVPALGYSGSQLADLAATIAAADCDAVIAGTPVDLSRLVAAVPPIRRVSYGVREIGSPSLSDVLRPTINEIAAQRTGADGSSRTGIGVRS